MRTCLGHVHLKVRDLRRAIEFYTYYFDLAVVEQIGSQFVFLTGDDRHHELALQAVGHQAPAQHPYGVGLYHLAFEVPDKHTFAVAYKALRDDGIQVTAVDHVISWAMYFHDPDGNGLEIYCDTRDEPEGARYWTGENRPLDEEQILADLDSTAS